MANLFVLGDLHFAQGVDKPMDIFGPQWRGHTEKIAENWRETVSGDDVVVVNGDISWGLKLEEAVPDLILLDSLPGRKIILKGNHELWWGTCAKLEAVFAKYGLKTMRPLYNNAYYWPEKNVLLCGTRGWKVPENADFGADDPKIMNRELMRFSASVSYGRKLVEKYRTIVESRRVNEAGEVQPEDENKRKNAKKQPVFDPREIIEELPEKMDFPENEPEIIAFLHYPPVDFAKRTNTEWIERITETGASRCFFGHIHGAGKASRDESGNPLPAFSRNGVNYYLTASDYLSFMPQRIDFPEI
ncbi:MAG: metallophosphoesterase [Clostridia bacterium]|nr:metallophosphoesterase [Clostridia bacterium]MBO7397521.1 metallophosphoesterase [Clostridia bacterium]MBO7658156.1 metallophosphoesterase [Clostridia bacterium]